MKNASVKILLVASGAVLFNIIFWQEKLAVNKPNKSVLNGEEGEFLYRSLLTPRQVFENRKKEFSAAQNTYTWLSWNMADDYVKRQFLRLAFRSDGLRPTGRLTGNATSFINK